MAARIARSMRDAAYRRVGRTGAGERRVPAVRRRRATWQAGTLRQPPADEPLKKAIRAARHPQLPPAVDRAHRHRQPRVRRQRVQRHRAAVLLDLHAHASAMADGSISEYDVEDHAWRLYRSARRRCRQACRPTSSPRWRCRRPTHVRDDGGGAALRRHRHLEDGQRARGLSLRRVPGPLPRSLEAPA